LAETQSFSGVPSHGSTTSFKKEKLFLALASKK